jgi:uncharacterized protein YjbI with pentapeptide repeats
MTEDNNQDDHPTEEQKPSDEFQTELREISEEELKQILEDHKIWLESDGKEGKRADLTYMKLQTALFYEANLQKAYLYGANLQKVWLKDAKLQEASLNYTNLKAADLSRANLNKAKLYFANLQGANLYETDLQNTKLFRVKGLAEANLHHANLDGATGLLGNEFAQADVTGTKLPDDIKDFKALEIVKETSQNARKIFFAMLLGCVYSWLTIATTTDVRLLTNTASSPLPIIGTEIPIAWFYIAAPLILVCLYFYFHLYLDNLWGALASLPAIFPDGKRLDERAYPWLLNTLVRRHFKRLKSRPLIARMKEWITIFLAWWVVPFTMIAFWLRYIPRHDWEGTIFHIGLIVLSVGFAIYFYRLCALTLQGKKKEDFIIIKFWGDRRFYYGVSVISVAVLFSVLSYGAIEGNRLPPYVNQKDIIKIYFSKLEYLIPGAFEKAGYNVFVDFGEKDISIKPSDYYKIENIQKQIDSIRGANLRGRNLNNADISKAFLIKADLRNASLENAILIRANLQQAILFEANLYDARLNQANLQEAILVGANLHDANLRFANLQETNLRYANLQKAFLLSANLHEANLSYANLQQAYLESANLLTADLSNANLQEAYLIGAKNITIDQLSKVKTLYKAELDPELLEQIKKCCPHLLEEPKEEPDKTN